MFSSLLDPQTFAPVAIAEVNRLTGKATVYQHVSPDQDLILAFGDTPEPAARALPSVPAMRIPALQRVHRNNQ